MDLNLKGKVVAITGGSLGIGKAAALEFAKEGCRVAFCGRNEQHIRETISEITALNVEVFAAKVDVSKPEELSGFVNDVVKHFGALDIWISNAATNLSKPLLQCSVEDWDTVMNTNLRAFFYGDQTAANKMIALGTKGVIINVSSIAATLPPTAQPIYAAAKAAVNNLTRSFAAECAPYNIRVAGIAPGWTRTERAMISAQDIDMTTILNEISLQRMAEQEEISKPLVFIASDACSYLTGTTMEITGGKFSVQRPSEAWSFVQQDE